MRDFGPGTAAHGREWQKILQGVHLSQAAGIQTTELLLLALQKGMLLIKEIF